MAVWGVSLPWYPVTLILLNILQTGAGLVLRGHPPTLLNTPQVIARDKESNILEPYTGNGEP